MLTDEPPLVSVVMPAYNAAYYLAESIESILGQTFTNFEFIIIDDASVDATHAIVEQYAARDARIVLRHNERNLGVAQSLNIGIAQARGRYIARQDADDISLPSRLQKQVDFLAQNPEVAAVFSHIHHIDTQGNTLLKSWAADTQTQTWGQIRQRLPCENCLAHPTALMRKEILQRYGYENIPYVEDYLLWLKLAAEGHILAKIPEALVKYRFYPQSQSQIRTSDTLGWERRAKQRLLHRCFTQGRLNRFVGSVAYHWLREYAQHLWQGVYTRLPYRVRQIAEGISFGLSLSRWRGLRQLYQQIRKAEHVFFFPIYGIGGAEVVHLEVVRALAGARNLCIFTTQSPNEGYKLHFAQHASLLDLGGLQAEQPQYRHLWISACRYLLSRYPPKAIVAANSTFFFDLLPYLPPDIPTIDLFHAFGSGVEEYGARAFPLFTRRVVMTQAILQQWQAIYQQQGLEAKLAQLRCIPTAVSVPAAYTPKSTEGTWSVLGLGRNTAEKRWYLFRQIAEQCHQQQLPLQFTLIGDFDEALSDEIVRYHAPITHRAALAQHYQQAHVLLLTSDREGFPMVIAEAMAQGTVPVATDVGSISTHVLPQQTGFLLTQPNDEQAVIAQAIQYLRYLLQNPELYRQYSQNAYYYAAQNFSLAAFSAAWRGLVSELTEVGNMK